MCVEGVGMQVGRSEVRGLYSQACVCVGMGVGWGRGWIGGELLQLKLV